jgi:hypothetical protein
MFTNTLQAGQHLHQTHRFNLLFQNHINLPIPTLDPVTGGGTMGVPVMATVIIAVAIPVANPVAIACARLGIEVPIIFTAENCADNNPCKGAGPGIFNVPIPAPTPIPGCVVWTIT